MSSRRKKDQYQTDPIGYCEQYLGVTLWGKQKQILEALLTPPHRVLVRSGHNVGKTFLLGCIISWFYDNFDPSITLATAPTERSLGDRLFAELRKLRRGDMAGFLPKDTRIYDNEEHWVQGIVTSGTAFQGAHKRNQLLAYDEAVEIEKDAWIVARGMNNGQWGQFHVGAYNPTDSSSPVYGEEQSGRFRVFEISQFDHPNIEADLRGERVPFPDAVRLSQVVDDMNAWSTPVPLDAPPREGEVALGLPGEKPLFRWIPGPLAEARCLGRWPSAPGESLWSEALFNKMLERRWADDYGMPKNRAWDIQIGADVAAFGGDFSAFVVKWGPVVMHAEVHSNWTGLQISTRLKQLCEHYANLHTKYDAKQIPCLIDAGGGWATDVFKYTVGFNFIPVLSNMTAKDDSKYPNIRSELWFEATDFAREGLLDISCLDPSIVRLLREELMKPAYTMDVASRRVVEKKLVTKAKLGRSPDLADAFNLACYWVHQQ